MFESVPIFIINPNDLSCLYFCCSKQQELVKYNVPLLIIRSLILHNFRTVGNDTKTGFQLFDLPKDQRE